MIKISQVIQHLERLAPLLYQESYDNSGLLTGQASWEATGALVTLDCTEAVVDEAIQAGCNLIVAHHPILFKGLKKLNGKNYVERAIIKAIKNDIAIYAIHTNLDNVLEGVNKRIADQLGLIKQRILAPRKDSLLTLVTFVPVKDTERVVQALHEAGAGQIGQYKNCSFRLTGTGTFQPSEGAQPHIGSINQLEKVKEDRVEVILPAHRERQVMTALRAHHPYEEVAYYLSRLENENQEVGAGIIGELPSPQDPMAFLQSVKTTMKAGVVRYTPVLQKTVQKVAVCGGAGSFLLPQAIAVGADVFISSDFKYHEFFDAEGKIIIADIGHFESEQYTKDLLVEVLKENFPTFAVNFSSTLTNPISYL